MLNGGGGRCGGIPAVGVPEQVCNDDCGGTGFAHGATKMIFVSFIVTLLFRLSAERNALTGGKRELRCKGFLGIGAGRINWGRLRPSEVVDVVPRRCRPQTICL